jgi:hypothetical protein
MGRKNEVSTTRKSKESKKNHKPNMEFKPDRNPLAMFIFEVLSKSRKVHEQRREKKTVELCIS